MVKRPTREQQRLLADFFKDISVGWFVAVFATPVLTKEFNLLTICLYIANMVAALAISFFLAKE